MVYPRLVFLLIQQDTPFLLLCSYTRKQHSSFDQRIDWFGLNGDDYTNLPLAEGGVIRSQVFPGLWLNVAALLKGDMAAVLEVLQIGTASVEHQAFVQTLASAQLRKP